MLEQYRVQGALVSGLIAVLLVLTGCGGSDDTTSGVVNCSIPCLAEAPSVDVSAVSSATGATVNVTFKLQGDIANVSSASILFSSTDIFSGKLPVGSGHVFNPSQAVNTIAITVEAGATQGNYYPYIIFTAVSPTNSGNQYYIDPTKSNSQYTYIEVISGTAATPALTGFQVPVITIGP